MKLLLNIIIVFLLAVPAIAQEGWEVVEWAGFEKALLEVGEQYTESSYSVDIRYSTFKGLKSTVPFESSVGYFQKSNNVKQTSILGVTTIDNAKHKITLDSINKIVALNNSVPTGDVVDLEQYKQMKSYIEFIKKKETKSSITYLIQYNSKSPISKTQLVLTKSGQLKSMIVNYAKAKEYRDENDDLQKDYLWLKMDYLNYSKKIKNKELRESQLLLKNNGEYRLTTKYKTFQLADLRFKK